MVEELLVPKPKAKLQRACANHTLYVYVQIWTALRHDVPRF